MRKSVIALCLVALLMIGACTHFPGTVKTDDVSNRAIDFWKAKQEGRWDLAYGFHCRAFQKDVTLSNYIKSVNVEIVGFKVEQIVLNADESAAEVNLRSDIAFQGLKLTDVPMKEKWVKENHNWYVCPDKGGFLELFKSK